MSSGSYENWLKEITTKKVMINSSGLSSGGVLGGAIVLDWTSFNIQLIVRVRDRKKSTRSIFINNQEDEVKQHDN